jgi:hypothetical protein
MMLVADSEKPVMEKIVVVVPLSPLAPKTMMDSAGNRVELPSLYEKFMTLSFELQANVKILKDLQSCKIPQHKVWEIDKASEDALIKSVFTRTYSFDAPLGTIPNLCKKQSASAK